jgi:hypothetical protein
MEGGMMRRKGILVLMVLAPSLIAAIVASGGATATEANPEWTVRAETLSESKLLKAGESEAIPETISTTQNWALKQVAGKGISIECPAIKAASAKIEGPKSFSSGSFVFGKCKVTAPAADTGCEVESTGQPNGTIKTIAFGFSGSLEGTTKAPKIKLTTGAEEIVTIQLKGAGCTDAGGYAVTGTLTANVNTSAFHKAHEWFFTTSSGTKVKFGGQEAVFTGNSEMVLSSGSEWGEA